MDIDESGLSAQRIRWAHMKLETENMISRANTALLQAFERRNKLDVAMGVLAQATHSQTMTSQEKKWAAEQAEQALNVAQHMR